MAVTFRDHGAGTHWLQVGETLRSLWGGDGSKAAVTIYPVDLLLMQIKY